MGSERIDKLAIAVDNLAVAQKRSEESVKELASAQKKTEETMQ